MVTPESVGMSSERLARIRPVLEKHIGPDKLAGAIVLLARRGQVVYSDCLGLADRENNVPMQPDTIVRLYSMTKPITCVALLMLYEQGRFQLFDPVAKFIPAFKDLKVYAGGDKDNMKLAPLDRPVTVRDLLTHTAGFTYPNSDGGPVEALYCEVGGVMDRSLADILADILRLPLAFQPGTAWRYGVSHDAVAHLVEVLSDQPFDDYLRERLFGPLGMADTGFYVPKEKLGRFAAMYGVGDAAAGSSRLLASPTNCLEATPHHVCRGGHGLVSTAPDYLRFCQMLLNMGELDGVRILGRKTVELMTANHLSPALHPFDAPGYGYGLGVRVAMDVAQTQYPGSIGQYGWSGAASTMFWVDPQEQLIVIELAQFQPIEYHPIGADSIVMAYQAIVD